MTLPSGLNALLSILPIVVTLLGAYLAALWFCLVIWAFRDIQKRTSDALVQILATVLVLVFNLPGLLLYVILRPPETLAEVYARSLEEEALLRDIEREGVESVPRRRAVADRGDRSSEVPTDVVEAGQIPGNYPHAQGVRRVHESPHLCRISERASAVEVRGFEEERTNASGFHLRDGGARIRPRG